MIWYLTCSSCNFLIIFIRVIVMSSKHQMKLNRVYHFRPFFGNVESHRCFSQPFQIRHKDSSRTWHFYYYHRGEKFNCYGDNLLIDVDVMIFRWIGQAQHLLN